jgi:hypothetical protein
MARGRNRGQMPGGYTRKTLSLPTNLVERIDEHLEVTPGSTISAFLTVAGEDLLKKIQRRS